MRSGSATTKANWRAMQRLSTLTLIRLRREHPDWALGDLRGHLDLPDTVLLGELARAAGFTDKRRASDADGKRVLRAMLGGVFSPREIARQTGLPLRIVKDVIDEVGVPFGAGGFGMPSWPSEGGADEGELERVEPRRVSAKGQISYKGRVYGLGARCAGRMCWVEEAGDRLIVHLPNRRAVALCR